MDTLSDAEQADTLSDDADRMQSMKDKLHRIRSEHQGTIDDAKQRRQRLSHELSLTASFRTILIGPQSLTQTVISEAENIQDTADITSSFLEAATTVAQHAEHLAGLADDHNEYNEALNRVEAQAQDVLDETLSLDDNAVQEAKAVHDANNAEPSQLTPLFDVHERRRHRLQERLERLNAFTDEHDDLTSTAEQLQHHAAKIHDHLAGIHDAHASNNPDKAQHDVNELQQHAEALHDHVKEHLASILDITPRDAGLNAYLAALEDAYDAAYQYAQANHDIIIELHDIQSTLQSRIDHLHSIADMLRSAHDDFKTTTRRLKDLLYTEINTEEHCGDDGKVPEDAVPDSLRNEANHLRQRQRTYIRSYTTSLRRASNLFDDTLLAVTQSNEARAHLAQATPETVVSDDVNAFLDDEFTDAYYVTLPDEDDPHRHNDDLTVAQAMKDAIDHIDDAASALR